MKNDFLKINCDKSTNFMRHEKRTVYLIGRGEIFIIPRSTEILIEISFCLNPRLPCVFYKF